MTYTSPYARNLNKMSNKEQVSLAQNRFTDAETQIAIAKNPYRLAREYLANNTSVTPEAANELWAYKGYVLKCALVSTRRGLQRIPLVLFWKKSMPIHHETQNTTRFEGLLSIQTARLTLLSESPL